jgi:hypothetical protein
MTGRRLVAFALALLLIAAPCSSAVAAEPALYTVKFVASGTVDGVPFTDEPLVFAGVTDTDTVAALDAADPGVDPATIQKIISALSLVAGIVLFAVAIIEIEKHVKTHSNGQHHILAEIILAGQQSVPVVRDGAQVTLAIDSIRDNTIELQFLHVAGGL